MIKNKANKFVLLAGLPRTGSTVLANTLAQNSRFYIEGNSGLCQLMWDSQWSCNHHCNEQLNANNKLDSVKERLVGGLPDIYYTGVSGKVILDKSRAWGYPEFMEMAKKYIAQDIKAIVMVRPIDEIVRSFAKLNFEEGGDDSVYELMMNDNSQLLMSSFTATKMIAESNSDNLLFISYENIVNDLSDVISRIYDFIGEDKFLHETSYIEQVIKENDSPNHYRNLHKIRNEVSRVKNEIILPDWVKQKCDFMTDSLFENLQNKRL